MRRKWFWFVSILMVALLCIAVLVTWFVRGVYDEMFVAGGHIHVVNCTDQPIDVTIDFPSGKQAQFTLNAHAAHDFKQHNTGEGNLAVTVAGRTPEQVGYVTSLNNMIVLSIDNDDTTFSQVFP